MSFAPCLAYAPPGSGIPVPRRRPRPNLNQRRRRRQWLREMHRALGGRCQKCGGPTRLRNGPGLFHPDHATIDHHIPLAKGGADEPYNWRMLCYQCNQDKADTVPTWRPRRTAADAPVHPRIPPALARSWLVPPGTLAPAARA